jgi:hypothetical protein
MCVTVYACYFASLGAWQGTAGCNVLLLMACCLCIWGVVALQGFAEREVLLLGAVMAAAKACLLHLHSCLPRSETAVFVMCLQGFGERKVT